MNPRSLAVSGVRFEGRPVDLLAVDGLIAEIGPDLELSGVDEVIDGRKFRFAVEVREGERVLGTGIHERRMIQVPPTE